MPRPRARPRDSLRERWTEGEMGAGWNEEADAAKGWAVPVGVEGEEESV